MSFTQMDVDALKSMLARGVRRGRVGGEEVEYADFAELRSVLRMAEAEVAGISSTGLSVQYPTTSRGL